MDATTLRALQAPIKDKYRTAPDAAFITLKARGTLDDTKIACKVETGRAIAEAGLHPATGGSEAELCSGDMLLEALVACAGVTLKAVATALEIPLRAGTVSAEGDLDFRGTLGVDNRRHARRAGVAVGHVGSRPGLQARALEFSEHLSHDSQFSSMSLRRFFQQKTLLVVSSRRARPGCILPPPLGKVPWGFTHNQLCT